ncbi:UDP-N-acetylmuramoyl-tripeptide--D-alanyl-D-alanine ligase [Sphingobacterium alkalisoli]|uniref:UDP-N-acetylmuramoyl-tripeptide--D-alanyl-D-alanine ligase n=1 Tax=Sphingobacterium alkalisoli TaxID=1874115 RepID=A0A4U0H7C7_9SPHI|nr:UDP-N-acetylmuramoyl-tripeptide--D-alanyl-D-alanine ligase [Sphingobacterium alkalisoli]TJY67735.1 UDP-N-acetylmuramoyl-tripeptide--D-alanyl-D-alanine ligase [Sphingobacterium alkalisoli]GGH11695.1 UDP-N-acetylmuramoyl-tripeptide--D-alanyl-D-alanine ligase [Sphingobacterium alkalisoli]
MQIDQLYNIYKAFPKVTTDTRNIAADSIFFALKGANFNGNAFAEQALAAGARYVVIDEPLYDKGDDYIIVKDVLSTLQDLAKYHRSQLNIPVIGITGTNGKTTTKELLYAVLSQKYNTFSTQGNLNNHIGVPLSLLSIDSRHEVAIIEMGANHVGEIALLSDIARPTHGIITNVGKAHLEGFGSFEGVKKAKGELYDFLQESGGILFLQSDNTELLEMVNTRTFNKIVRYGFSGQNDVIGKLLHANPYLSISWKMKDTTPIYEVSTSLTGSYNSENILAAIAVGLHFDVSPISINMGVEGYVPKNNRSQITKTTKNTVIADFYNANASSMSAALDNMKVLEADRKVVILGDMFEMGDDTYAEHQKIITQAKSLRVDRLIFVGEAFYAQKEPEGEYYQTTEEAKAAVSTIAESFILLKASRGMAFEKLLELL